MKEARPWLIAAGVIVGAYLLWKAGAVYFIALEASNVIDALKHPDPNAPRVAPHFATPQ